MRLWWLGLALLTGCSAQKTEPAAPKAEFPPPWETADAESAWTNNPQRAVDPFFNSNLLVCHIQPNGLPRLNEEENPWLRLSVPLSSDSYEQRWHFEDRAFVTSWMHEGKPVEVKVTGFTTISIDVMGAELIGKSFDDGKLEVDVASDQATVAPSYLKETDLMAINQWPGAISLEGPSEDQAAINSMVSALRMSLGYGDGFLPFGRTHDKYKDHLFWDADVWIMPAVALLSPDSASFLQDRRVASALVLDPGYVKFPWEADERGEEGGTGPTTNQLHVSASVAWGSNFTRSLGITRSSLDQGIADYYLSVIDRTMSPAELRDIVSVDEYKEDADNDLYTNIAIEQVLRRAGHDIRMKRPKDETGLLLTYDNDERISYKQTAALLAIWPLQDAEAEAQADRMLAEYADKVIEKGPAMSESIHALLYARQGDAEEAYRRWHKSWKPYMRSLMQFSEKPNTNETYFMTGAAGCLNAVIYGFCGIRIDESDPGDKSWKRQLKSGAWISAAPHLPEQWEAVTLESIQVDGEELTLRFLPDRSVEEQ